MVRCARPRLWYRHSMHVCRMRIGAADLPIIRKDEYLLARNLAHISKMWRVMVHWAALLQATIQRCHASTFGESRYCGAYSAIPAAGVVCIAESYYSNRCRDPHLVGRSYVEMVDQRNKTQGAIPIDVYDLLQTRPLSKNPSLPSPFRCRLTIPEVKGRRCVPSSGDSGCFKSC